ncbi:MAG TPA: anti-phage dCTP deaminase [Chthoniobacteraceae bacterium]|nr:anti-phage dCTP deaminase [Chthoniobacteraceae bacterium]
MKREPQTPPPELVIGLIGAVGTNAHPISECLTEPLASVGYRLHEIHAIDLLARFRGLEPNPVPAPLHDYYHTLMDAGNQFRARVESNAVFAYLAMSAIREARLCHGGDPFTPLPGVAYLVRSLKTPEEIRALREAYGQSFIALAAYSPKAARRDYLRERIRKSVPASGNEEIDHLVTTLLRRDEVEPDNAFGQNLEATFPLADFFVETAGSREALQKSVTRIVELLFGNVFHAPSRDEYGMFHAVSAGVRSSSLARQVGASICTDEGEIIALGCNDVPKAGGGLYWEGDEGDSRDHLRGHDSNDGMKRLFVRDILGRLKTSGWLREPLQTLSEEELFETAMEPDSLLRRAELMKVIEYGRSVHAEMAALMDAVKRGITVKGCTLYTTTFPCHNCAKHIVASGVRRVVYVEPYPKSFTHKLYADSIWLDGAGEGNGAATAVRFEPFVGISPRQYLLLFSMGRLERKSNGKVAPWRAEQAGLRHSDHPAACLAREQAALDHFRALLLKAKVRPGNKSFWNLFEKESRKGAPVAAKPAALKG